MTNEKIVNFSCDNKQLIGILHQPEQAVRYGLICIVAGAAQYRIGCCRQQVTLARKLAEAGVPVMRFDYRGMGDAEGEYPGSDRSADINAAIDAFLAASPELDGVVLYGGCDGATAVAIAGWRHPKVAGWVLNNPHTAVAKAKAKVAMKHYYIARLRSPEFWKKALKLKFDFKDAWQSLSSNLKSAFGRSAKSVQTKDPFDVSRPFTERMLEGWKRFDGSVLLLMSERSIVAREFDACLDNSADWRKAVETPQLERVDLKNASHTFSDPASLKLLADTIEGWFKKISV